MPLGGTDKRWDVSWEEQDKIRRRMELKNHLKQEGITKRFSPYLMLKAQIYSDPAIERYMDLRRRGRLPNTPLRPSHFYAMMLTLLVPIAVLGQVNQWERQPYLDGCASGDIPYSERYNKTMG